MAKTFKVGIYSREQTLYEGEAVSLVVPSESGYMGILADHTAVVAKLASGKITLRSALGKSSAIDIPRGGFFEVLKNQATILL